MFREYNPNPNARRVGDCVVRALCKALDQTWIRTFLGLVLESCVLCDMPSSNSVWGQYLRQNGFIRSILPDECTGRYTVADFAAQNPHGVYVLATGSHVVCVADGDWYDTWDSGSETPAYFWTKEANA